MKQPGLRTRVVSNLRMRLMLACLCIGAGPTTALAVITSGPGWDYIVTAGEPLFGVNLDSVVRLRTDNITKCSAALVSDRHLLSAAHCFDNDWDSQPNYAPDAPFTAVFELPSGDVDIGFTASDVQMLDDWVEAGADLAVIRLPVDAPPDAPRYPVYGARDEIGKPIVVVGYGSIGSGATGESAFLDEKLAGRNRYEATRDAMPSDEPLPHGGYLVYDFDSGSEENNALALFGFESDLGFAADEVKSASGDSGAPTFIDAAIAGIVSFGGMGFDGDLLPDVDGTWGELGFDTRLSSFRGFLTDATDGQVMFVAEPASGLLLTIGMILLRCASRLCTAGLVFRKNETVG